MLSAAGKGGGASAFTPNEDGVAMIESMGFTREQAIKALKSNVSGFTHISNLPEHCVRHVLVIVLFRSG